jgi:hypothetical protein
LQTIKYLCIPTTIRQWNSLDPSRRNVNYIAKLKTEFRKRKGISQAPKHYEIEPRKLNIILTQLRCFASFINYDLFQVNIVSKPSCYWTKGSYIISWCQHFDNVTIATMTWLTVTEYMCHKWSRICSTCRKHFPVLPYSWLITGFVTTVAWRVALIGQELLIPQSTWVYPRFLVSGVRIARSLVFCVMFCISLFVLLYFWPMCCLSCFSLRILVTPLVSSKEDLYICIYRT